MGIGERIQKLGFKRWYERTLIEGHVYLVTAVFGLILAFAALEVLGERQSLSRFIFGFAAGGVGMTLVGVGIHRYYRILILAQSFGERATCGKCNTYAAFNVLASGTCENHEPEGPASSWLRVKCRCGHEWRM